MLNGQLPLTAAISSRALARPSGRVLQATMVILALALAVCTSTRQAPIVDMSQQPAGDKAAPGGTYVVKPGDSLYRIARSNNVDVDSLRRWNNITDPNQISVGQVLKLSGSAAGGSGAAPSTPPSAPQPIATAPSKPSEPVPLDAPPADPNKPATPTDGGTPPAATPATPSETPKPATPAPPRASDANVIAWGWPASGAIMQQFNSNTKGIDIAGAAGDPVVAAADGKVMYSGNGVRGPGNLVIINHQNGFITAYAHNRALLVKTGQDVKRGAKIAEIGQTDTTSPRLHFEIRRQGTPVDPLQYLPAR